LAHEEGEVSVSHQWIINEVDQEKRDWISRQLDIPPLLAAVLVGRGFDDPDQAKRFLEPRITDLNDPFLLPDIDVAVGRIRKAIIDHERILIFGHDDTDGATSVTVMKETLKELGARADDYIPDRAAEGYGFRRDTLERFKRDRYGLIITVDSESSDFPGMEMAGEIGIDVVITDHHEIQGGLPRARAVINPKRGDSRYPFRSLAGVGVAYQLARALCGDSDFDFHRHIDLVALGTIADRVPLVDDNRVFSRLGNEWLRSSTRPGVVALGRLLGPGADAQEMNGALKFGQNHGGRFSSATLLQTADPGEARTIAEELVESGRTKRQETQGACDRVVERVSEERLFEAPVIIVIDRETPIRALGACASMIRRQYGQPAVVIGFNDERVVGEGRAPTGFDIFAAFQYCEDLFIQYGGHRGAGGFSMDAGHLNDFRQKINQYAREITSWRIAPPYLRIDAVLDPARLQGDEPGYLQRLSPFGQANASPQFCCYRAQVEVFERSTEGGILGRINGVPFRLADVRSLRANLLATLSSARLADVAYGLTPGIQGGVVLAVEDVKVA
jgi:single-stranded-DNA-specific exonuclease